MTGERKDILFLIFYVGCDRFAIDSDQIIEIIPMVFLKKIPHAPDYIAGIFNYRGTIVPVIDLSALIGKIPAKPLLSTRIILVDYANSNGRHHILGLLAERVTETLKCRESDLEEMGIRLPETPYLGDVVSHGADMIQWIKPESILPEWLREALFADIGGGR